jgi:aflatoxin B1 aldehyde reductase
MPKRQSRTRPIVALGAMTFGGQTSAADAGRMLGMFLDAGHNWVDTAYMYTGGKSERILGRLLRGARREKVYLATKAHPSAAAENTKGLTPAAIRSQLETSLKRLKMDYVDLLYLHAPDNSTPLEVTLAACEELRSEGKLCEVGLSNYASWQVTEAVSICHQNGWEPPTVYQGMYNAITRLIEEECLPACRHFGVKFLAYNPLAGGLLTAKYETVTDLPSAGRFANEIYQKRFWKTAYFEAIETAKQVSDRAGVPLADAAIRWLMRHSMTDGILLGASKIKHLEQNLNACNTKRLSPSLIRALDKAWEIAKPACQRYFRD